MTLLHVLFVLVVILPLTSGFAAQGHWELSMSDKWNGTAMKKSMYRHSKIAVNIHCEGSENASPTLRVQWRLYYLQCSNIMFLPEPGTLASMQTYWGDLCVARYEAPVETITCTSGTVMTLTDRTNEVFAAMNVTKPPPANFVPLTVAPGNAAPAVGPTVVPVPTSAHIREGPGPSAEGPGPSAEGVGPASTGLAATNIKTGKHKRGVTIGPDVKQASKKPIKKTAMQTDQLDPRKIAEIGFDGIYVFTLHIESVDIDHPQYNLTAFVWMKGPYGYLSVIDWPLLPFYGTMCVIYIVFGLVWFVLCACNWRDLLRIQLWIGAIIVLGMLEKAVFFAEYESLNVTGHSVPGAVVFAELVSCVKRALARMLVVIISIGFGIVKPRLGPMLHRIVGMGVLYFILASVESCMRALQEKSDVSKKQLLAAVPLAVLDATICWWIFTSLVQVMRTLRLRRNLVKLSLYRHFTNTLIFAVLASIGFMAWTLKQHKVKSCISDWKELWVDDAFWHLLFSVILMVIMVLWRPTNTNQRYAFSAISDTMDEQDEAPLINDAFDGMKMRGADTVAAKRSDPKAKTEDDLKWIEENIPASVADVALPSLLDSDEEVMTTKFEMSKME